MCGASAYGQTATYRGFSEVGGTVYPQTTPQDDDRFALEALMRLEVAYKPAEWLTLSSAGDARLDNLEQVEREWRIDIRDRTLQRPALSVRQASATVTRGRASIDVGKQFIRWGTTDILTPTDRFAPRDFLEVTDGDFLAVAGARVRYTRGAHSVDAVWVPRFTPSRIPLPNRRWSGIPTGLATAAFTQTENYANGSQYGLRYNYTGTGFEASGSFFDGFNNLPEIVAAPVSPVPRVINLYRTYAPLRMVGADAALPLRWFTLKGEAGLMKTTSSIADDFVLYVIQLERQSGELSLVGGYAGEVVTAHRSTLMFAPDRGLAHSFLGRATYTLNANRSVSFEGAIRENLDGVWIETEYSEARGPHWRFTLGGTLIAGIDADFIGQYSRNSYFRAALRYSF
jgi:hypothetical protein